VKSFLVELRWRDALDVLLVAVIVYRILVLFRGTRTVQMLIGLGALVVATLVARSLELYTLQWLLDNFWSFWVIALVVVFQPELRRLLAWIGQGRLFQGILGTSREERAQVVDEVAGVAETLAARRIGALVVLERTTGLRQYAELGVPLDALVSADLLTSLFLPYSPLHDGAVFIQGNRVVAAGCFLPLSRNTQIGRTLGTRHRAALGIAEETDAVAVVVSEETGRMSIAVDGRLESLPDVETVRARLHDLLGGAAEPARPARSLAGRLGLRSRAREEQEAADADVAGRPSLGSHDRA
jgi:diadenylate cyclase